MSTINESTFQGYVSTTHDALLIFEAVRRGIMPKVTRRLRDDERKLVRSGQVFVFDERESGIKRWTDGLLWSPSRILWNFLVYRQIDKKLAIKQNSAEQFQAAYAAHQANLGMSGSSLMHAMGSSSLGQGPNGSLAVGDESMGQVAAMAPPAATVPQSFLYQGLTRGRSSSSVSDSGMGFSNFASAPFGEAAGMVGAAGSSSSPARDKDKDLERTLVGSLTSSYPFVKEGLCKKTISIQVEGSTQHLISYYSVDDVRSGRLRTPSSLPEIASLQISPIFLNKSNFRNPPHIETGPDGVPRYRGDALDTPGSSRKSGGNTSSDGTTSGSDSRDSRSMGSPSTMMVPFSPSVPSNLSSPAADYRHPHQIGGSGAFAPTSTAITRRMSDVPLRSRNSRYEPYPHPQSAGPASASPHYLNSPPDTPYPGYPVQPNQGLPYGRPGAQLHSSAGQVGWQTGLAGPSSNPAMRGSTASAHDDTGTPAYHMFAPGSSQSTLSAATNFEASHYATSSSRSQRHQLELFAGPNGYAQAQSQGQGQGQGPPAMQGYLQPSASPQPLGNYSASSSIPPGSWYANQQQSSLPAPPTTSPRPQMSWSNTFPGPPHNFPNASGTYAGASNQCSGFSSSYAESSSEQSGWHVRGPLPSHHAGSAHVPWQEYDPSCAERAVLEGTNLSAPMPDALASSGVTIKEEERPWYPELDSAHPTPPKAGRERERRSTFGDVSRETSASRGERPTSSSATESGLERVVLMRPGSSNIR